MLSVLLAVLAATSNALASVLQRKANRDEVADNGSGLRSIVHLLRRPLWLAGLAAVIASFGLQAGALASGELALVQPLLALELPLTIVLASWMFSRRLPRRNWLDILAMSGGLALLLLALLPQGGDPRHPGAVAWLAGAGGAGLLVLLLLGAARAATGSRRAALLGMASGVSFALTALFMSAALAGGLAGIFTRWQTYLVAVSGLVAMLLLQEALQAGSLVAVQPGVTLVDPVVAILLGVLLFHEQVRTGWWVLPEVAGAVAIGWGTLQLSRSSVVADEPEDGDGDGDEERQDQEPAVAGPRPVGEQEVALPPAGAGSRAVRRQ